MFYLVVICVLLTSRIDLSHQSYDFYNTKQNPDAVQLNVGKFHFMINKNNLSLPGCGLSSFMRIVNGKDTMDGEYPFAALLYRNSRPFGGAVIINEKWILSAAHNFHSSVDGSHYSIGVGSAELKHLKLYKVNKIFIHPEYKRKQKFDIALIKLTDSLKFGEKMRPICLPEYSFQPVNSDKARVVGWGYHDFYVKKVSQRLQEVDLDIISNEKCLEMYSPLKHPIVRSQICTWSYKKDSCSGDSGGPLFVYKNDRAVLFGVVSFGVTCADEYPGVFTAVSYYLNWIGKILQEN